MTLDAYPHAIAENPRTKHQVGAASSCHQGGCSCARCRAAAIAVVLGSAVASAQGAKTKPIAATDITKEESTLSIARDRGRAIVAALDWPRSMRNNHRIPSVRPFQRNLRDPSPGAALERRHVDGLRSVLEI